MLTIFIAACIALVLIGLLPISALAVQALRHAHLNHRLNNMSYYPRRNRG